VNRALWVVRRPSLILSDQRGIIQWVVGRY